MMRSLLLLLLAFSVHGLRTFGSTSKMSVSLKHRSPSSLKFSAKEPEKEGWDRIKDALEKVEKDGKGTRPPIYEPGPYPQHLLAALAYVIPIVDASDLGKYMFEAYPDVGAGYNLVFGGLAGIYNGVPFLPFAVFFLMSYICRAPTFPAEIRFHFAQAFMLSVIQFVPSFGLGLLEKGGVPGLAVPYNTAFLWVTTSCVMMQILLINPLARSKNPFLVNIVGWSMRYMNWSQSMLAPPSKK